MTDNHTEVSKLSRRQALNTVIAASLAVSATSCAETVAPNKTTETSPFKAPPLPNTLLVNRERAAQVMRANDVDAIICSRPDNIYYLTNYYPQLAKMGMEDNVYAILPLDIDRAPILVVGQFEFYLAGAEGVARRDVDIRLFTMPANPEQFSSHPSLAAQLESPGVPSFLPTKHNLQPLSASETLKQNETMRLSTKMGATSQTSFLKALRDIPRNFKRVAIDNMALADSIRRAEIDVSFANGEQLLRRIRLQKSPGEIALMRYAANANAQAGLAAAKIARDGATFQDIRREFNRQCVERFMTPEFMVIDSVVPDLSLIHI